MLDSQIDDFVAPQRRSYPKRYSTIAGCAVYEDATTHATYEEKMPSGTTSKHTWPITLHPQSLHLISHPDYFIHWYHPDRFFSVQIRISVMREPYSRTHSLRNTAVLGQDAGNTRPGYTRKRHRYLYIADLTKGNRQTGTRSAWGASNANQQA